jgi:hypothetical protein
VLQRIVARTVGSELGTWCRVLGPDYEIIGLKESRKRDDERVGENWDCFAKVTEKEVVGKPRYPGTSVPTLQVAVPNPGFAREVTPRSFTTRPHGTPLSKWAGPEFMEIQLGQLLWTEYALEGIDVVRRPRLGGSKHSCVSSNAIVGTDFSFKHDHCELRKTKS